MMLEEKIRPLTLCIIKNKDKLLVGDGYDSKKDQVFYRLLGGGIEFGETGEEALNREFMEELETKLENVKYLATLENVFTYNGKRGHEIVLIFSADLAKKELYQKSSIDILDCQKRHKGSWQKISDFKNQKLILYPNGILNYI
jgi:NADH pyrophosphatase NudC (nudix superfamily)